MAHIFAFETMFFGKDGEDGDAVAFFFGSTEEEDGDSLDAEILFCKPASQNSSRTTIRMPFEAYTCIQFLTLARFGFEKNSHLGPLVVTGLDYETDEPEAEYRFVVTPDKKSMIISGWNSSGIDQANPAIVEFDFLEIKKIALLINSMLMYANMDVRFIFQAQNEREVREKLKELGIGGEG